MTYTAALKAYLARPDVTQAILADNAGVTQASISRYVNGRLPDRAGAEAIDRATGGLVPFTAWQSEQAARLGVTLPHESAAA